MIIFKDILTGDEMFTDANKYELIDDCLYEVVCNQITKKDNFVLDGANPSAEGDDEGGAEESSETGLDLVLNQRLQKTSFDKSAYKSYLKSYTTSLSEKWKEQGLSEEEIADCKAKIMAAVKKVLPKIDEYQFFCGESFNPDGMVALLEYREKDGAYIPHMLFFKQGLEYEKV